jgi:hypothetical protein
MAQNDKEMTIKYPNGTAIEAVLLARATDVLRVAVPGHDDPRIFSLVGGAWISESGEQVNIQFQWERHGKAEVPSENDCVCSKVLASRLISIVAGGEADDVFEDLLYLLSIEGLCMPIQEAELNALRMSGYGSSNGLALVN